MEWILVICTQAWGLCGMQVSVHYPNEQSCYRALDEVYKRQGKEAFKYVLCKPANQPLPK